jgi:uncharacterized protein (DUF4415 family)
MAVDNLEPASTLPPDFQQAADPRRPLIEPPKVMVSLPLDADILAWFESEGEPRDMQRHINGVLRYYMETNLMQEADAELAARTGQEQGGPEQPSP